GVAASLESCRYPTATHPLPLPLPATPNRPLTCAVAAVAEVAPLRRGPGPTFTKRSHDLGQDQDAQAPGSARRNRDEPRRLLPHARPRQGAPAHQIAQRADPLPPQ